MSGEAQTSGPDLAAGIPESDLAAQAMLLGHVGEDAVLLARSGDEVLAIGATCTHYGGPLAEGLRVGDTVRCPWHHACFSLRTGEALAAPALSAVACWRVQRRHGRIIVREKAAAPASAVPPATVSTATAGPRAGPTPAAVPGRAGRGRTSGRIVLVGGGAAGFAAAEMLRRDGYDGAITLLSADADAPYDRPNLSKDYLAGTAPEEWIPLRAPEFYTDNRIELRLATAVQSIDPAGHQVILGSGESITFSQLLLATGAEPVALQVPGSALAHVRTLRSLADCRQIIAHARAGSRAVIVGASFIGLEAAAALRRRQIEVHVVAPEARPMERVFGPALADFVRSLHEAQGVVFHLGHTVAAIDARWVRLDDGSQLDADLVLAGIGVRPRLELAAQARLAIDRGVLVDEYLRTSAPDVFAAGDIARWPDAYSGQRLRIEHWVVAERQGQLAARNMLGRREPHAAVPFFWTQQYDVSIDYVGHAADWDRIEQDGDISARDVALRFRKSGRTLAMASIFRGRESLEAEHAMEQAMPRPRSSAERPT